VIVVVVLVLAGLAVLGAVVVVAMGRGGELSRPPLDLPPLPPPDDRPFTGPQPFALTRTFWGYQVDMTDEMIHRLRHAVYERDVRLAALERQVTELRYRLEDGEPAPGPNPDRAREDDDPEDDPSDDFTNDLHDDPEDDGVDLLKNDVAGGGGAVRKEAHS
jgi:hypothetical protein